MVKLLCTVTTKIYSDGSVETKTEPYREAVDVEEIKQIANGVLPRDTTNYGGQGLFGLE